MGVPITFLDKWVPKSNFKIVKFRKGEDNKDLTYTSKRGGGTTLLPDTHSTGSKSSGRAESTSCSVRGDHTSTASASIQGSSSNEFEILGLSQKVGFGLKSNKCYDNYREVKPDRSETGSSGKKTNGNPMIAGIPRKGNYYVNGKNYAYSLYGRIFIKRKESSNGN
jgi:hypothetical protein